MGYWYNELCGHHNGQSTMIPRGFLFSIYEFAIKTLFSATLSAIFHVVSHICLRQTDRLRQALKFSEEGIKAINDVLTVHRNVTVGALQVQHLCWLPGVHTIGIS